jgi:plastocyanin
MAMSQAYAGSGAPPKGASAADRGSISGRVRFEGQAPKLARAGASTDPACPKTAPGATEEFVTGTNGSLGNVVVYISEGLSSQNFDVPAEPVLMEQKGCQYEPHVVALRANQTLKVVNDDKTMHNIHPMPANNREWNKAEAAGATVEEKFAREEIGIPVKCNVHPWMRGYIAVFKHPYFAVTGKDGSFDLSNLPPGEYTVQAWHEKLGTVSQKITVVAGQSKNIELDFKGH